METRPRVRLGVREARPVYDHSWRDKNERKVKGWDRGKKKRVLYIRRAYAESLTWDDHKTILAKAGIDVDAMDRKARGRLVGDNLKQ